MRPEDIIREQADKIVASGVLGRSKSYGRLFDYLVSNSIAGRQPKEIEIATEVFSKDSGFDPSQDSMVRVYAHNLRQKLKSFYDGDGAGEPRRLTIPRGEYRLAIETPDTGAEEGRQTVERRASKLMLLAATAAVLIAAVIGYWSGARGPAVTDGAVYADTPFWSHVLDDDLPVLVVVGDYYIFAELDEDGNVARFVREFSINSPQDLEDLVRRRPEQSGRYQNLDVTYLARSTAAALGDVFRVLYSADKAVSVVSMSELNPADLRTNHVVYVGYISALDKLFDFVFAASHLAVGDTFDQLFNLDTGVKFTSEAGRPNDYRNYRDYGFYSTFPGPGGNQFAIIAGTRDEGVMQIAQIVTEPMYMSGAASAVPAAAAQRVEAFEMLYEVTGFDRTNIDAMLVHTAALDSHLIWRGDLLQFVDE